MRRYSVVIFSVGFFGLLAQTLLFRYFLAVFQGNEISTGLFFFSWLLWIAAGAFLGWIPLLNRKGVQIYEFLLLLYIPACLAQAYLLFNARTLVGAAEYELISFWKLGGALTLFNSPIGLVSGFLFVTGTNWIRHSSLPAGKVYVLDAAGSFCGALTVTALLYWGVCGESIFLAAAFLLCIVPLLHNNQNQLSLSRKCAIVSVGLASLMFAVFFASGFGLKWHDRLAWQQWSRMLPGGTFHGSFNTPQARYCYGNYRGEFCVVRWNNICESLPNREASWAAAAENLAQKPNAKKMLIIGAGALALCRNLCELPTTEQVVWLDTDPDYPSTLLSIIAPEYRARLSKLSTPRQDVRAYLAKSTNKFDLIISLAPAPSSLALNRYYSADFYRLLDRALASGGVLSVGFPGGENFLGPELKLIGASLLKTLLKQFKHVILKPGRNSRFFASGSDVLSGKPEILAKRLAGIKVLAQNFPPDNIYALFEPFRAQFQMAVYRKTITSGKTRLYNSDDQPVTSRFATLLALKKSGSGTILPGAAIAPGPLLKLILWVVIAAAAIRIIFQTALSGMRPATSRGALSVCRIPSADIMFFVWITSVVAMAVNIMLMYVFQVVNGSIFLYFGMISALFMLGLFLGGWLTKLLFPQKRACRFPVFALSLAALLATLRLTGLHFANITLLGFAFLSTGLVCGVWLPGAAAVMLARDWKQRNAAWLLWVLDSLGGAVGGLLCAALLLPLFGALQTLDILLVVSAALLALAVFLELGFKRVRKSLLIPALLCLLCLSGKALNVKSAARSLSGKESTLTEKSAVFRGKRVTYYQVGGQHGRGGYVFRSSSLVKGIKGIGGELDLLMYTDREGKLLNFKVLQHHETEPYFRKVTSRRKELLNKNVFTGKTAFKTDAVSGATYTSKALVKTLNAAGKAFRAMLSGEKPATEPATNATSRPPPAAPRAIDVAKYRKLIANKELSDHKAMYCRKEK